MFLTVQNAKKTWGPHVPAHCFKTLVFYHVFGPFKNVVKTVKNCKKWQKTTFGCRAVPTCKVTWAIFVGIYRCLVTWRLECMHFYITPATGVAECMHFYVIPVTWVAQCMHFYVICWAPLGSVYRVFGPFKNVVKTVKN